MAGGVAEVSGRAALTNEKAALFNRSGRRRGLWVSWSGRRWVIDEPRGEGGGEREGGG